MSNDLIVSKLRASVEAALKAKNLDQVIKYRTLLHHHAHSATPAASSETSRYLTLVDQRYHLLLKKEVETHIKLARRSLQTVSQWLMHGNGLEEFENELFNEDSLNKVVLEYSREGQEEGTAENDVEEDEAEQEEESKNCPHTVPPRRAAREWKKCEDEATYLHHPRFNTNDDVTAFLAAFNAMRPAALLRMELEDVRRIIKVRGAARRYARLRAALIRGDAVVVLRHYQTLRDDAARVRTEHPAHRATEIFAARAEALVRMVEERRPALEAQCEAEKERRMSGVKEVMKEMKEVREGEERMWKDAQGRADAVNQQHKNMKEQQARAKGEAPGGNRW